jgi:AcrR family transcriptional regulator
VTPSEPSRPRSSDSSAPAPASGRPRRSAVRTPAGVNPAGADSRARQQRGARRRQQILDAAVELFASKGYQRTGVAALAERVGMTATGLLYYFGSKERLLHEVVAERDRVGEAPAADALTLDLLRNLGRHNADTATLTRLYVVLGAENIDAEAPLHEFFVSRYETARSLVQSIFEAEILQGRVRPDVDVDQLSREVIGMVMGTEIQWLTDPERVDLDATIRAYIDRLAIDLAP